MMAASTATSTGSTPLMTTVYSPLQGLHPTVIANYRLVLRPSAYLRRQRTISDSQGHQKLDDIPLGDDLTWEDILALRKVRTDTERLNCPICLDEVPRCPVAGSCGHMFCWWCILRHIGSHCDNIGDLNSIEVIIGKRAVHATCPVCSSILAPHELKPVSMDTFAAAISSDTTLEPGGHIGTNTTPQSVSEIIGNIKGNEAASTQLDSVAAMVASMEGDGPAVTSKGLITSIGSNRNKKPNKQSQRGGGSGRRRGGGETGLTGRKGTNETDGGLPATVKGDGMEACVIPAEPVMMKFIRVERPHGCLAAQRSDWDPIDSSAVRSSQVPYHVVHAATELTPADNRHAFCNVVQVASHAFIDQLWKRIHSELLKFASECATEEKEATKELLQMQQNYRDVRGADGLANLMHRWSGLAAAAGSWKPYVEIIMTSLRLRKELWFEALDSVTENNPFLRSDAEQVIEKTKAEETDEHLFSFMQSATGELAFLHPLSAKLLLGHYHSSVKFPQKLVCPVVSIEGGRLTNSLRSRFPYLAHLPTGTPFWVCELDLRKHLPRNIVSACGLKTVIQSRNKARTTLLRRYQREQEQKLAKAKDTEENNLASVSHLSRAQLFAKYMGSTVPSDSQMMAPVGVREQLTANAFSFSLADRPEAKERQNSFDNAHSGTTCTSADSSNSLVASRAAKGWNMAQVASKNVGGGHFPSLSRRQRSDSNSSGQSFASQRSSVSVSSRERPPPSPPQQSWSSVFKTEPTTKNASTYSGTSNIDESTINTAWSQFFKENHFETPLAPAAVDEASQVEGESSISAVQNLRSGSNTAQEHTVIKLSKKKKSGRGGNKTKMTIFSTGNVMR